MAGQRRQRRREQILAAAAESFAAGPYAQTPLEDVARRAGVTRMMLYRYFESKEDIYRAVLDQVAAALTAELEALDSPVTSDAVTRVHFAVAEAFPHGYRLFWERARADDLFAAHTHRLEERVNEVGEDLLAAWVDLGPLRSWSVRAVTAYSVAATLAALESNRPLDAALVEEFASEGLSGIVTAWVQLARDRRDRLGPAEGLAGRSFGAVPPDTADVASH